MDSAGPEFPATREALEKAKEEHKDDWLAYLTEVVNHDKFDVSGSADDTKFLSMVLQVHSIAKARSGRGMPGAALWRPLFDAVNAAGTYAADVLNRRMDA